MKATTMRRVAAGALVLGLMTGATACGSEDEAAGSGTTTTAAPKAACDAAVQVSSLFNQAPQDPEAIKGYAADTLVPAAEKLAAALPEDMKASGTAIVETFETVAEDGDPSAIESKEYTDAVQATGKLVHERCGLRAVDVVAKDYVFSDLPSELKAGRTSFALANEGEEGHEMVVFHRADGETRGWDELSQLPPEEQEPLLQFSGVAWGDPGSTAYTTIDLEPGTYIVVCTMPVGGHEEGKPHFMEGMQQEITVT